MTKKINEIFKEIKAKLNKDYHIISGYQESKNALMLAICKKDGEYYEFDFRILLENKDEDFPDDIDNVVWNDKTIEKLEDLLDDYFKVKSYMCKKCQTTWECVGELQNCPKCNSDNFFCSN